MYGNLKFFTGQEAFDCYSHHLRDARRALPAARGRAVDHPRGAARGDHRPRVLRGRAVAPQPQGRPASSAASATTRNAEQARHPAQLRVLHAAVGRRRSSCSSSSSTSLHLTANDIRPGWRVADSPYDRVVNGFEIWWVVLAYTIALLAVGLPPARTASGAPSRRSAPTTARRARLRASRPRVRGRRGHHHHRVPDPALRHLCFGWWSDLMTVNTDARTDDFHARPRRRRSATPRRPTRPHREALGRAAGST